MYRSLRRALERQAAEVAAATEGRGGGGGGGRQQGSSSGGGGRAAAADPNEHIITAGLTVLTWFLVAWSRCMPVLLLGSVNALLAVLLHCGLRRAPSEYRYRGRAPLGFTWSQLVGRGEWRLRELRLLLVGDGWCKLQPLLDHCSTCIAALQRSRLSLLHTPPPHASLAAGPPSPLAEPVPEGAHTTAVLREMAAAGAAAAARRWHMGKRYLRYYLYTLLDVLRHPGQLLGGGGGGGRAAWR